MNFSLSYPLWFLLLCFLAGAIYTSILYHNDKKFADKPSWLRYTLRILRFLVGFIIAFLLLAPIFKDQTTEKKEPLVVFLKDQSQSIASGASSIELNNFNSSFSKLKGDVNSKYEVVDLGFGQSAFLTSSDSFNQKTTNIAEALKYVYDTYADQNIGAIVLASDGIFNEGANPLYSNAKFSCPIYTIGLGDTTIRKDLVINDILSNKIAYLGDKFTIQVGIGAKNADNTSSKITIFEEDNNGNRKFIGDKIINVKSNNDYQTFDFVIDAQKSGVVKYTATVGALAGENNTQNNRKDFYVEIIDARIKVLIYANSPHPDIGALFSIIEENKNYEVSTFFSYDNVVVTDYDFVIFHNLPSTSLDLSNILKQLDNKGVNRLYFVGTQTDQNKLNAVQSVISLTGNSSNTEIIEPTVVGSFDKFLISDEFKSRLPKYPPLVAPFGSYKLGGFSTVLLNQKIKKVPTQNPLMALEDKNGKREGVIVGEVILK
ncbi:MAG TPA: hypothetical protein PKD85_05050 [Saprospiraceae bacterium]|nr:hypothetical protein [Saprospiraceae bacterium]